MMASILGVMVVSDSVNKICYVVTEPSIKKFNLINK